MRVFTCPSCDGRVFFGDLACATCGTDLVFDPVTRNVTTGLATCANRDKIRCNWAAPGGDLCVSCEMTEIVPDHFSDDNLVLWAEAEAAKRWVLDNLAAWGWMTATDPGPRPRFHLVSEATRHGQAPVTMGHADGLVTINVTEADPVEQVRRRTDLDEPYRTMIGHFRHELAHFLYLRLSEDPAFVAEATALMGDFSADYGAALSRHYENGPPEGWADRFVTAYASAHPHEDWAETAAHLLHLTDILDSAIAVDMGGRGISDAYGTADPEGLITSAVSLGIALNHVNRAMGLPDLYPFVISPAVREKLALVHRWCASPTH